MIGSTLHVCACCGGPTLAPPILSARDPTRLLLPYCLACVEAGAACPTIPIQDADAATLAAARYVSAADLDRAFAALASGEIPPRPPAS